MSQEFVSQFDNKTRAWPFPDKPAREVQLKAIERGYGHQGFAYFLRQRLGKTLVAFAEYTLLREEGKVDWMMVICPNSLKGQWKEAIEEVDPFIPVHIYNSNTKKDTDLFFKKNKRGGVFIINYESMKSFYDEGGWSKFNTLRTYLVADESTKIKDWSAKMAKASVNFADACSYKRLLTGRPKANNNLDLWAQLRFINATNRTHNQHKFTFSVVGGYQGKQIVKDINDDLLKKEIEPHCYIAEDRFIRNFGKCYEPIRRVHLTGTQAQMYKQMHDDLIFSLSDDLSITAPIALTKYLRLQQISSGIAGDEEGKQHNIVSPSSNPRIDMVKEIIEDEIDGKVIIICRFKLSIYNIVEELEKEGIKCLTFHGGMSTSAVETLKYKFNNDTDYKVLVAQSQVLSFGHTLPGPDCMPCEDVIFFENTFSLLDRIQCESRPEKFERGSTISYWDLACSKMDKYMLEALIRKEEGSLALMDYSRSYGIMPTGEAQLKEIYGAR